MQKEHIVIDFMLEVKVCDNQSYMLPEFFSQIMSFLEDLVSVCSRARFYLSYH